MREEHTNDKLLCPYCASVGDCSHLLAAVDRTFCEWYAGYAFERYDEFRGIIEDAFRKLLRRGTLQKRPWSDPEIADLWQHALKHRSPNNEDVDLDEYALSGLIVRLLQDAGADEHNSTSHPGVPGFEGAMSVFYAEDPASVFKAASQISMHA